jgi:hypothetical protein
MLARPRACHGDNAATWVFGMIMSEPLNECTVVASEPLVDRAQYLAASVIMFTDIVKRGVAKLLGHKAPISTCPERVNGAAIVM